MISIKKEQIFLVIKKRKNENDLKYEIIFLLKNFFNSNSL